MKNVESWWRALSTARAGRLALLLVLLLVLGAILSGCGTATSKRDSPKPSVLPDLMAAVRGPMLLPRSGSILTIDDLLDNHAENAERANECRSIALGWQRWAREHKFAE